MRENRLVQELRETISRQNRRLLKYRFNENRKVDKTKARVESLYTPKGRFFLALNRASLIMDRIINRKLWRDYHR